MLATCAFCEKHRKALPIEKVADIFEHAFKTHYKRTRPDPTDYEYAMIRHGISNDMWLRDGEPVVEAFKSAARISTEIAEEIRGMLAGRYGSREDYEMQIETEFDSDSHYEESGTDYGNWPNEWANFTTELQESSRYFSNRALDTLRSIFDDIGDYRTREGAAVIVEIGPCKPIESLFRARAFQDREKMTRALEHPDAELGPPSTKFAFAGRMNPSGISVFYGALRKETALSEVRPVVGSQVVVARFDIVRNIRVLDLASLNELGLSGSVFDPQFLHRLQKAKFLGSLGASMVSPVMPNDELFEYLPTQVVCDYLASRDDLLIDGILYRSVQSGAHGRNVVLFHHACRVEEIHVPDGATVSSGWSQMSNDPEDAEYQVTMELPAAGASTAKGIGSEHDIRQEYEQYMRDLRTTREIRNVTLRLNANSINIHRIEAVEFKTSETRVTLHTYDKTAECKF